MEKCALDHLIFFFFSPSAEVFLGTGFFELRGGEMFFGQKKNSRASRAKTLEKLVCGVFWNTSALWWGQFDEMGKFLVLLKNEW